MDKFDYEYTAEQLAAIKSAWQFSMVPEGDYQKLDAELDLIDVPVEQEQRRLFAYLLASSYAEIPLPKIAARWHEVLSSAYSADILHLIHTLHTHTERYGNCPAVYDQHFMTWVGHYSRLFNHNSDYMNALGDMPVTARSAALLVAAQKWVKLKEPGDFYYSLLTQGPERKSMHVMAVQLMNTVACNPAQALLFVIATIYPEIAADSRRPMLRPEHEPAEFLMSRRDFAKPLLDWLGRVQPQALVWYNELQEKVQLCDNLDVPAHLSIPIIMTEPNPDITTPDNPDNFAVFRDLVRTTSFYGERLAISQSGIELPSNFGV